MPALLALVERDPQEADASANAESTMPTQRTSAVASVTFSPVSLTTRSPRSRLPNVWPSLNAQNAT